MSPAAGDHGTLSQQGAGNPLFSGLSAVISKAREVSGTAQPNPAFLRRSGAAF
jgi:hypothetical protein